RISRKHDIGGHSRFPGTKEWVAPSAPPTDCLQIVNQPQTEAEVAALRCCVNRGRRFGDPNWVTDTAEVWWSGLVFGSRLDPCHDLLEFIGQSGTGSHWPSRDRWRPQIGCVVVGTFPQ